MAKKSSKPKVEAVKVIEQPVVKPVVVAPVVEVVKPVVEPKIVEEVKPFLVENAVVKDNQPIEMTPEQFDKISDKFETIKNQRICPGCRKNALVQVQEKAGSEFKCSNCGKGVSFM